jgi:hypothetical protein
MTDPLTRITDSHCVPSLGVRSEGERSLGEEAPGSGPPKRRWVLVLLGRVALGSVEVFFLLFGIYLLILSYRLTDPLSFIMTFFASNLMILISGALLLGLVLKFRKRKDE